MPKVTKNKAEDNARGLKLLQKIRHSISFNKGIKAIRLSYQIPETGFNDKKSAYHWYSHVFPKTRAYFLAAVNQFLKTQALPINTWWRQKTIELVIMDNTEFLPKILPQGPFIEIAEAGLAKEGSFVLLKLHEGVAQRDVISYVKSHWNKIKPSQSLDKSKMIRGVKNPDIDDKIMEIWDRPRNLSESKYKELAISKRLKDETGTKLSPEAIKMRRYRKRHAKR